MTVMTRILGTPGDQEDTPVTVPQRRIPAVPGANGIPWYAGVPGLDPDARVADWYLAARCAAMACAALALGAGAGHRTVFRSPAPAGKWCAWLLSDRDEVEIRVRILALRLTCEQHAGQPAADADHVLRAASDLYAGCAPR